MNSKIFFSKSNICHPLPCELKMIVFNIKGVKMIVFKDLKLELDAQIPL